MTDHLTMLATLCGPSGAAGGAGFLLALLIAGAMGSVVHCAPMCGPFVLGQVANGLARIPAAGMCERHRMSVGLLPGYHLGRIGTYAALGALAAGSSGALASRMATGLLPAALLAVGAVLFLGQAIQRLWPRLHAVVAIRGRGSRWAALVARLATRIGRARPRGGVLLGAVLGFLPCGFLYAALAVAASTGSGLRGALAMAAFGIGTATSLIVLGIAGQVGGRVYTRALATAGPALLVLNAAILAGLAWQRLTLS